MLIDDCYRILGVSKSATRADIQAAFRDKSKKYHPDRGGDDWAFIKVREAYEQLVGEPHQPFVPQQEDSVSPCPDYRTETTATPSPVAAPNSKVVIGALGGALFGLLAGGLAALLVGLNVLIAALIGFLAGALGGAVVSVFGTNER